MPDSFPVPVCTIVIARVFNFFFFLLKVDSSSPVEISSASGQGDNAHAITFWRAVLIPVSCYQLSTTGHSDTLIIMISKFLAHDNDFPAF